MLSLAQAAHHAGKNRSTILRAIKSGHLSAGRDAFGRYEIQEAELTRVYPQQANGHDTHDSAIVTLLREQLDEARRDRDAWKEQAQRLALTSSARRSAWSLFRRAG